MITVVIVVAVIVVVSPIVVVVIVPIAGAAMIVPTMRFAVVRRVDVAIPVVAHEVDPPSAGVVIATVASQLRAWSGGTCR